MVAATASVVVIWHGDGERVRLDVSEHTPSAHAFGAASDTSVADRAHADTRSGICRVTARRMPCDGLPDRCAGKCQPTWLDRKLVEQLCRLEHEV